MGVTDFRSIPNVPIIGEATIFEWRPLVTAQCACRKGKPMLLIGTGAPSQCDGCGKVYAIAFVQYDAMKSPTASIAIAEVRSAAPNGNGPAPTQ